MHIGIQLDISFYFYNIRLLLCLLFSCAFLHELISFAFFVSFFFFFFGREPEHRRRVSHTHTHALVTHTHSNRAADERDWATLNTRPTTFRVSSPFSFPPPLVTRTYCIWLCDALVICAWLVSFIIYTKQTRLSCNFVISVTAPLTIWNTMGPNKKCLNIPFWRNTIYIPNIQEMNFFSSY